MRKLIILVLALCLVLHPSPALSDEQYFEHRVTASTPLSTKILEIFTTA